ncbi:MAG: hypothetical protein GTO12_16840 [Proteobacteria bacterium]|nr:hypothetical protein [Pseudomonadota bacterium]
MMHSISQHTDLPHDLEQTIVEKAEGNPFFLEELTRAIIEHGDLQADMTMPDTIQGVLSARIDRLPEAPKRLLQTAFNGCLFHLKLGMTYFNPHFSILG